MTNAAGMSVMWCLALMGVDGPCGWLAELDVDGEEGAGPRMSSERRKSRTLYELRWSRPMRRASARDTPAALRTTRWAALRLCSFSCSRRRS